MLRLGWSSLELRFWVGLRLDGGGRVGLWRLDGKCFSGLRVRVMVMRDGLALCWGISYCDEGFFKVL